VGQTSNQRRLQTHHKQAFFDALAHDFNTPTALGSLFEWVREAGLAT